MSLVMAIPYLIAIRSLPRTLDGGQTMRTFLSTFQDLQQLDIDIDQDHIFAESSSTYVPTQKQPFVVSIHNASVAGKEGLVSTGYHLTAV